MNDEFTPLSVSITKNLDKATKKSNGIYFTPHSIIKNILDFIQVYSKLNKLKIKNVLEPSCGSCQFVNYIDKILKNINIDAIELNYSIFLKIQNLKYNNHVEITNKDFLQFNTEKKYDLIIGNPPYYVMKKNEIDKYYNQFYEGRPNIYVPFIVKSLSMLKNKGILSFVLPNNFLNCYYYNKLRYYIHNNFRILKIKIYNETSYIETGQETCSITLQKLNPKNEDFVFVKNDFIIFNSQENIKKIKNLYHNTTTISDLGFNVSVGSVVWNQVKNYLTNDSTKTRLIYNSDIVENKLNPKKYKDEDKKNFIDLDKLNKKPILKPLLVVNRGYGKGEYTFSYCLLDTENPFIIENHLICIKSNEDIDKNVLIEKYKTIINSFNNEKTKEFVKIYFGNNAINTKELETILPIYI